MIDRKNGGSYNASYSLQYNAYPILIPRAFSGFKMADEETPVFFDHSAILRAEKGLGTRLIQRVQAK